MTRGKLLFGVSTLAAMCVIAPAAQALYVNGHQLPAGNSGLKYKMAGGLVGKWKITHFHVKHERNGLLKVKGQERFTGCVDVVRDDSCSGDPAGKLFFRFRYWVSSSTSRVRTSCWARARTASSVPPVASRERRAS